jgi:uncharacterized protein (DUF1697 family)
VPRYVALLRGINVGGRVVKMDRLRALFEALKLRRVETLIASGNVLFDAAARDATALERRVERHLADALGFDVATFVRTPDELARAAARQPFAPSASPDHALWIGFLKSAPPPAVAAALVALGTDNDSFHVGGRELYWRIRTRSMQTLRLSARLERALGGPMTVRNVTTVRKLAERAHSA